MVQNKILAVAAATAAALIVPSAAQAQLVPMEGGGRAEDHPQGEWVCYLDYTGALRTEHAEGKVLFSPTFIPNKRDFSARSASEAEAKKMFMWNVRAFYDDTPPAIEPVCEDGNYTTLVHKREEWEWIFERKGRELVYLPTFMARD